MTLGSELGIYIRMPVDRNGKQIRIGDIVSNGHCKNRVSGAAMVDGEPCVIYDRNCEWDYAGDVEKVDGDV